MHIYYYGKSELVKEVLKDTEDSILNKIDYINCNILLYYKEQ